MANGGGEAAVARHNRYFSQEDVDDIAALTSRWVADQLRVDIERCLNVACRAIFTAMTFFFQRYDFISDINSLLSLFSYA